MQDLKGRVAFITGGASGIGLGIARACAEAGMKLALADVDAAALASAQAEFEAQGHAVRSLRLDVRDAAAWDAAVDQVERELGPVQLLCNNAGITGSGRRLGELAAAEWQAILDINLGGLFLGVSCLLPRMRGDGREAHIVNTASLGALLPYAGGAGYVASKAGMLAFSECLRQELAGSAIGVSVLLPAMVRTRLFETSAQRLAPGETDAMSRRAEASRKLDDEGLDPLQVGRQLLAAVRTRRFHVFTHPQLRPVLAERFDEMLASMDAPAVG